MTRCSYQRGSSSSMIVVTQACPVGPARGALGAVGPVGRLIARYSPREGPGPPLGKRGVDAPLALPPLAFDMAHGRYVAAQTPSTQIHPSPWSHSCPIQ